MGYTEDLLKMFMGGYDKSADAFKGKNNALEDYLKVLTMKNLQDERAQKHQEHAEAVKDKQDAAVEKETGKINEDVNKSNLPSLIRTSEQAKKARVGEVGPNGERLPGSYGPIAGMLPTGIATKLGEYLGKVPLPGGKSLADEGIGLPEGATNERLADQAVTNEYGKTQMANRPTTHGIARENIQLGKVGGVEPQEHAAALQEIEDNAKQELNRRIDSAAPAAAKVYRQRNTDIMGMAPQKPSAAAPPSDPEDSEDLVSVISPEGKSGKLPRSSLPAALQRGFKQQ